VTEAEAVAALRAITDEVCALAGAVAEYPERWEPVPRIDGCAFSGYQCSTMGLVRSLDRTTPGGRALRGTVLKATPGSGGYVRVKLACDDPAHKPHTLTMQKIVLRTFAGECPPGMEARHLDSDPANNRWAPGNEEETRKAGGNLVWGTKAENHADKDDPQPPKPTYPCLNAFPRGTCDGKALNPGRRCIRCTVDVGIEAARMLRDGQNLETVRQHFGYKTGDWVFGLAVRYGGYPAELKDQARTQQPPLKGWRGWVARRVGAAG